MTKSEWNSGIFKFCPLCFVFNIKCNGRHKIHCIAGRNRLSEENLDVSEITAQNTTVHLILLAAMHQRYDILIANIENVCLNTETTEKVCTKLGKGFGELGCKIVRIIRVIYRFFSSSRCFWTHLRSTLRSLGFTPLMCDKNL